MGTRSTAANRYIPAVFNLTVTQLWKLVLSAPTKFRNYQVLAVELETRFDLADAFREAPFT